jgi:hypothetical protein
VDTFLTAKATVVLAKRIKPDLMDNLIKRIESELKNSEKGQVNGTEVGLA